MDPGKPDIFQLADVVVSTDGRDQGELFYVTNVETPYLLLVNGKDRTLDKPKRKKCKHVRKVLRSETRVAVNLPATKCSTVNYEEPRSISAGKCKANNLGG